LKGPGNKYGKKFGSDNDIKGLMVRIKGIKGRIKMCEKALTIEFQWAFSNNAIKMQCSLPELIWLN
jgi:hypothetical protein